VGDEHVHRDAAGWPGDQRIDVKASDQVACISGQRRQPDNRVRHGGHVGGRCTAEAVQQPPRLEPAQHVQGPRLIQRRQPKGPVREELHQHSSGPGHHQRPELRVAHNAERHLGTRRDHGRHRHLRAKRVRHLRISRRQQARIGNPKPDAASV